MASVNEASHTGLGGNLPSQLLHIDKDRDEQIAKLRLEHAMNLRPVQTESA